MCSGALGTKESVDRLRGDLMLKIRQGGDLRENLDRMNEIHIVQRLS